MPPWSNAWHAVPTAEDRGRDTARGGRRDVGRAGSAVDHDRLERPDQPYELVHACLHDGIRLRQAEGREAHAGRPPSGAGRRVERNPRAHGTRREHPARLWPVGDPAAAGLRGSVRVTRRRGHARIRLESVESGLLATLLDDLDGALQTLPDDDPVRQRLFPVAYRDDDEAAEEFRLLNAERSPTFYRCDSVEQLKVWHEMDEQD